MYILTVTLIQYSTGDDCSLRDQSITIQSDCMIIIIRNPVIYITKNLSLTLTFNLNPNLTLALHLKIMV